MSTPSRWPAAFAAVCGLLYPITIIVGDDMIGAVAGEAPGRGTPVEDIVAWATASNTPQYFTGRALGMCAMMFLLIFVSYMTTQMRRFDDGWLPRAAYGFGLLAAGLQFFGGIAHFAAVRSAGVVEPAVTASLLNLGETFALALLPLGLFIGASGLVAIRGGQMARWVGWFAVVLAVAAVVGFFVQASAEGESVGILPMIVAWFLWFPCASVNLVLRALKKNPAPSTVTA